MSFEHTTCDNCAKPIVVEHTAHYCSSRCRVAAFRARKRGEMPRNTALLTPPTSAEDQALFEQYVVDGRAAVAAMKAEKVRQDDDGETSLDDGLGRISGLSEVKKLLRALHRVRQALKARPDLDTEIDGVSFRNSIFEDDDEPQGGSDICNLAVEFEIIADALEDAPPPSAT